MKHHIAIIAAFAAVSARIVILGASVGDALAIAALAALYGFYIHQENHKPSPESPQLRKEIDDLKSAINAIKVGNSLKGR